MGTPSLPTRLSGLGVLLVGALWALPAGAQLYKWTDASGQVQYSDRPPVGVNAEPLRGGLSAPAPRAADGEDADDARPNYAQQAEAFRKRREEAAEAQRKQAEAAAQEQARADHCQRTRAYLRMTEAGGRMVRTNEQGEREFLSDAQMRQEAARAREELARHCS